MCGLAPMLYGGNPQFLQASVFIEGKKPFVDIINKSIVIAQY